MKILFLFLDGIGLGKDEPEFNPFSRADMPYLRSLLNGNNLTSGSAPFEGDNITLKAVDAVLGVQGLPQSATGQSVLLTGLNIPAILNYHYGPKPNPEISQYLDGKTLFAKTVKAGKNTCLLNAYPPRYFDGIDSGRRLYSAIPLALTNSGVPLFTQSDFYEGRALSADFTGEGWRDFLGFPDAPLLEPFSAGRRIAELARDYDFSLFEYWASDYAGHKQDMNWAVRQLEVLDQVLMGLFTSWRNEDGLILLTSDHGNMEDLSTRRHTASPVPLLLYGDRKTRDTFHQDIHDLTGIAPAISNALGLN